MNGNPLTLSDQALVTLIDARENTRVELKNHSRETHRLEFGRRSARLPMVFPARIAPESLSSGYGTTARLPVLT